MNRYPVAAAPSLFAILLALSALAGLLPDRAAAVAREDLIETVESAITEASDLYDAGQITPGEPFVVALSPKVKLSFAAETFDDDIDSAFSVLEKLMSAAPSPSPPAPGERKGKPAPTDRISSLRAAEGPAAGPAIPPENMPMDYDVFLDYGETHRAKQEAEDMAAEADMQSVLEERRAASEELRMRNERKRELQAQATQWQAELDRQAAESAKVQAAFIAENSFGAYTRRILGTVLETGVGAFGSAFLGGIGSNLADAAVKSIFRGDISGAATQQAAESASSAGGSAAAAALPAAAGTAAAPASSGSEARMKSKDSGGRSKNKPASGTSKSTKKGKKPVPTRPVYIEGVPADQYVSKITFYQNRIKKGTDVVPYRGPKRPTSHGKPAYGNKKRKIMGGKTPYRARTGKTALKPRY